METKKDTSNDFLHQLDELLDDEPAVKAPSPDALKMADRIDAALNSLKATLSGNSRSEVHASDAHLPIALVKDVTAVLADAAAELKMFRKDPKDDHVRTPEEVKALVVNLIHHRGTSYILDMLTTSTYLDLRKLSQATKDRMTTVFGLAKATVVAK